MFTADIKTKFDMTKIPFDDHWLELQVGSLTWDSDLMHIIKEEMIIEFDDNFMIPGWEKIGIEEHLGNVYDPRTNRTFSTLINKVQIIRTSWNCLYKIVIPVIIFVFVTSLTYE